MDISLLSCDNACSGVSSKKIYEVLTFLEGVTTSAILTSTGRMRPAVCKNKTLFYKTSHKPTTFLILPVSH